ncbi:MAG: histidine kinase [Chitinophagaceae bacterium]|nr:histidine kinase [Chitinophagaceae bacterium]
MALAVLLIAGVLFLLYKWRIRQIKSKIEKENNMQSKMAELEQTALRSQMNPHFIFNCLTSIQQLIATGNKDEANEYLVKFSRLIRNTLELSARQYIAIIDEVEYIKEYVAMEQLRVADTFEFNFKIDENINTTNIEIPNMMIQPIVENAIRHGIKHLQNKKGKIDVELIKIEDVINCTVTDNGVGRTLKAEDKRAIFDTHKSYGMNIVMQRLQGFSR